MKTLKTALKYGAVILVVALLPSGLQVVALGVLAGCVAVTALAD
jgi:hypothetical protein